MNVINNWVGKVFLKGIIFYMLTVIVFAIFCCALSLVMICCCLPLAIATGILWMIINILFIDEEIYGNYSNVYSTKIFPIFYEILFRFLVKGVG